MAKPTEQKKAMRHCQRWNMTGDWSDLEAKAACTSMQNGINFWQNSVKRNTFALILQPQPRYNFAKEDTHRPQPQRLQAASKEVHPSQSITHTSALIMTLPTHTNRYDTVHTQKI